MAKITDLLKLVLKKLWLLKNKPIDFWLLAGIKTGVILILFTHLVLGVFSITVSYYPKAVFFRSLTEFIFILYLLLIYFNRKYLPKISPLVIAVSAFVGALLLCSIAGINFHHSFFGDLRRVEGVMLDLHLLAFFLIITSVFRKKEEWFNLFKITIIVSGLSSMAAVLQYLGIWRLYGIDLPYRVSGTLTNPVFFGTYLTLIIFLALFVLLIERKKIFKILWTLILLLNFCTLFLSGTRAAWIGMGAGLTFLFLLWFFHYSNLKPITRKKILFGILFFLFLVFLIILNQDKFSLTENPHFRRIVNSFNGDVLRVYFPPWKIAIDAWRERPILGWGPESSTFLYDRFFKAKYLNDIPEDLYFDRVHNKFLELLSNTGIIGLLSYLSVFAVAFYLLFKYQPKDGRGKKKYFPSLIFASLLVAYLAENFFAFDTISTYLIFYLVLGFVNNNFRKEEQEKEKEYLKSKGFFEKIMNIFLLISWIFFFAIVFYQINLKPTRASLNFVKAAELEAENLGSSVDYYKKAIDEKNIYKEDFQIEAAQRLLDFFEEEWAKNSQKEMTELFFKIRPSFEEKLNSPQKMPRNFYETLFGINEKIYLATGNYYYLEAMEETAKKAIEFNPEKPRFYQLAGHAKIFKKEYKNGEEFFGRAYELTPQTSGDKMRFYMAQGLAYYKSGEKRKGAENFKKALDIDYFLRKYNPEIGTPVAVMFMEKVAITYCLELKDFKTCRQIYERAMEIYPQRRELLREHLEMMKKNLNF